ncbi:ATP-dependent DNA helicase RecG [Flaviflagellibacter deserti]|uniref:ATP-dependent DNA helicase RecG n=1 Tax=Flaviflagellibacter deserti TaxID=2267266 RepID=A0ABV9Z4K6_9HYPH
MRPPALNPLFSPVETLQGFGEKSALPLKRLLGDEPRVLDVLFHLPSGIVDRRMRPKIADAVPGGTVTLEVTVEEIHAPPRNRPKAPTRIVVTDGTGWVTLVFFGANKNYVERQLPIGAKRWISGRLEQYDGMLQMVHPERIVDEAGLSKLPLVEPVYPLTEGVTQGLISRAARAAAERIPDLAEWQDPSVVAGRGWPRFREALRHLHLPLQPEDAAPESPSRHRLAYDELLSGQLALGLVRRHMRHQHGRSSAGDGRIVTKLEAALPFALTGSQVRAVHDIRGDLAKPERMLRLLQGDVGSGKTVVALLAMATVVEAGRQAAMMAPTEILARQHLKTIKPLAEAAGLRVAILTAREKGREREAILANVAAGDVDILVGTHALFQEIVAFKDLAFAVVDEQHRFGVHQRLALAAKGEAVDVLVMTATPIPRTLVLTYFGDMEVSALHEKPAGRKPIDTRVVSSERVDEVIAGLHRALETGSRVYWVCPLVSESDLVDAAAAEERYIQLSMEFPGQVALVHGKMRGAEKDSVMAGFASGQTRILVATTVIEVGVDVPEANIMVIEHAERFGLAQLHQLRGRVGRGDAKSTCVLVYKPPLGETAEKRLKILRETEDGFRIAEEDLRLRGEGEVLGTRQSGLPGTRLANVEIYGELLETARKEAVMLLDRDPHLTGPRGPALRTLLYLFEREEAARLLSAG